eukprot:m.749896 g.749896  ORF g.749896 m.749896 type:complete len:122 (+) comp58978_c0_seq3:1126-1491(+)
MWITVPELSFFRLTLKAGAFFGELSCLIADIQAGFRLAHLRNATGEYLRTKILVKTTFKSNFAHSDSWWSAGSLRATRYSSPVESPECTIRKFPFRKAFASVQSLSKQSSVAERATDAPVP